jgi:hypothetical protein
MRHISFRFGKIAGSLRSVDTFVLLASSIAIVLGHLLFFSSGFTNLEFAFAGAARHFAGVAGDGRELDRYFAQQANPLGYSFVTAAWLWVSGVDPSFWSVRVPALSGALLILVAGWMWTASDNDLRQRVFPMWCAAIAANPLVWCYAGQATADVLPTGLLMLAFALCVAGKLRLLPHAIASALFASTCVIKYNALLLLPLFLASVALEGGGRLLSRRKLILIAVYAILAVGALAGYAAWLYASFGIFMVPDRFRRVFQESTAASAHLDVFWSYLAYLAMVCGVFGAILPMANARRIWVGLRAVPAVLRSGKFARLEQDGSLQHGTATIAAAICSIVGLYGMLSVVDGEMDQGGFDHLFPKYLFSIAKCGGLFLAVYTAITWAFDAWRAKTPLSAASLVGVAIYLVVSSLTRPAQRYLLLILPLVMWHLVDSCSRIRSPWRTLVQVAGIGLFCVLSFVGSSYLAAQGDAADRMARWIARSNLTDTTDPGPIGGHAGQHFPPAPPQSPRFAVTVGTPAEALHTETMRLFGRPFRSYSLVPSTPADSPTPEAAP